MTKAKFQIFQGRSGLWYFRLRGVNGLIIAQSEGYARKENAIKGVRAAITAVQDIGADKHRAEPFEVCA